MKSPRDVMSIAGVFDFYLTSMKDSAVGKVRKAPSPGGEGVGG